MRFVGIVLLIGLVAGCSPKQPVPVRIGYVETDVPSSSQCVEITGAFQGRPYQQLRMAYSQNGKVSYKILNETPCFMQDTVLRLQMAVEPVHKHTARFTLNVDSLQITKEIELEVSCTVSYWKPIPTALFLLQIRSRLLPTPVVLCAKYW